MARPGGEGGWGRVCLYDTYYNNVYIYIYMYTLFVYIYIYIYYYYKTMCTVLCKLSCGPHGAPPPHFEQLVMFAEFEHTTI